MGDLELRGARLQMVEMAVRTRQRWREGGAPPGRREGLAIGPDRSPVGLQLVDGINRVHAVIRRSGPNRSGGRRYENMLALLVPRQEGRLGIQQESRPDGFPLGLRQPS